MSKTTKAWRPPRGWRTPVREGASYCAPFCGRGCTYEEYSAAVLAADALAARLGPNWKPYVQENVGWHYHVYNGPLKVAASKFKTTTSYTAYLGNHDGGICSGYWTERGKTPQQAVRAVIKTAEEFIYHEAGLLAEAKGVA